MGYMYKVHLGVYNNRSIETVATLFDKNNVVLHQFKLRAHGYRSDGTSAPWPDFGVNDFGLNQFTTNGNTVTGVAEIDFNSAEPNPQVYGPYPINRWVRGLQGNALLLLPNIRDSILIHTGNWSTPSHPWTEAQDMPDSSGCMHGHPSDIDTVAKLLQGLGVVPNPCCFGGKNYPYKPQGVGVVELMD